MMARVLVPGGNGMLGSVLVPGLRERGHEVLVLGRSAPPPLAVDLTDGVATHAALQAISPDVIVNLAALTNVDACEQDPGRAFDANARSVQNLAAWVSARRSAAHLVQVSTDQVYDGQGPHREAGVRPINYYAYSKALGEAFATQCGATILRTNMFGRSRCAQRKSLSDWLVERLRSSTPTPVFTDVLFSPLSFETVSRVLCDFVESRIAGTYNLGSRAGMSKADFAFRLAETLGLSTDPLVRGVSASVALVARRPADMRMDCGLIESRLGVPMPELQAEITLMGNSYASSA
jgi:dTDP-4-dehydrorhamnose reductase